MDKIEIDSNVILFCNMLYERGDSPIMKNKYIKDGSKCIVMFHVMTGDNLESKSKIKLMNTVYIPEYPREKEHHSQYLLKEILGIPCNIHRECLQQWFTPGINFCMIVVMEKGTVPYTHYVEGSSFF